MIFLPNNLLAIYERVKEKRSDLAGTGVKSLNYIEFLELGILHFEIYCTWSFIMSLKNIFALPQGARRGEVKFEL